MRTKIKASATVLDAGVQLLGTINTLQVFGMDIAKLVFQVHSVHPVSGKPQSVQLKRADVVDYFNQYGTCFIALEACGSAHYWGRTLQENGHVIRLLPTTLIQPFISGNKSDAIDARAIWLAAQLPDVKFVSVKSVEQQAVLTLHRQRDTLKKFKTRQLLALRGLLYEFGLIFSRGGRGIFLREVMSALDDETSVLPEFLRGSLRDQVERIKALDASVDQIDVRLKACFDSNEDMQRVATIPGVGMLTATAIIATMGNPATFNSGREFCAWLGLVPKQFGSGGKIRMLGISKKGDAYIRTLLIHGARSVLFRTKNKNPWLDQLRERRPMNIAVVAQAAKTARIIWAVTAKKVAYHVEQSQLCDAMDITEKEWTTET